MTNVLVETLTDTSVLISWNSVALSNVQGYTIYYRPSNTRQSEELTAVTSFSNSATISGLRNGVEYQFQVVAIIAEGNEVIIGERSILDDNSRIVLQGKYNNSP